MEFKYLIIVLIFLLSPCLAHAGTGEKDVKIVHTDGTIDRNGIEVKNEHVSNSTINKTSSTDNVNTGTKMVKDGVSSGLIDAAFNFADQFLAAGFSITSVGIEENAISESKTLTYSLYNTTLNPFGNQSERYVISLFGGAYIIWMFIYIFVAYIMFVIQKKCPMRFSDVRAGILGEESYFDFHALTGAWLITCLGPWVSLLYAYFIIQLRNVVVSAMTTTMVGSIGTSSESLPIYLIVNFGWFVTAVEKDIGGFGIYLLIPAIIITWAILSVILLFTSVKFALKPGLIVCACFTLIVFMDIITMFCWWIGVESSHSIGGIMTACAIDGIILLILPIYILFKIGTGKRLLGVY